MPQSAYRDRSRYNSGSYNVRDFHADRFYAAERPYYVTPEQIGIKKEIRPNQKKIQRNFLIHKIISFTFFLLVAIFVMPAMFKKFVKPVVGGSNYTYLKADYNSLVRPVENYLANDISLGVRTILEVNKKTPKMLSVGENSSMNVLRNRLITLQQQYPTIHSAVYVWDYSDGNYVDINADEIFSAASIIKLPVLVALFRNIENGQTSIYDEMVLNDYFRAEGSGGLQYKAENSKYSIDTLARIMITNSDNSATNMLMAKIGGMPAVNRQIKDWGLASTHVNNWLPDMEGSNYLTARDVARILYNIENPKFLNSSSREKILELYNLAVQEKYRFFSFGDCMFIE